MEKKIAHLGFIQTIIERMARCSFLLRGWAVTLVSAIFALAAKDANTNFVLIAYFPVISFWILDGYYLYQERLFRALYDDVANKEENAVDFKMDTTKYDGKTWKNSWVGSILSVTCLVFNIPIIGIILLAMYVVIPAIK